MKVRSLAELWCPVGPPRKRSRTRSVRGRGRQGKCDSVLNNWHHALPWASRHCTERGMADMMPPHDCLPAIPIPRCQQRCCRHTLVATGSLLALILLCLAWELVLAPCALAAPGWPSRPCRWPPGGHPQEPYVHLPLGQPGDLAVFHRRRGARLERQAPIAVAGLGRNRCAWCCSPPARCMCACASATPGRRPIPPGPPSDTPARPLFTIGRRLRDPLLDTPGSIVGDAVPDRRRRPLPGARLASPRGKVLAVVRPASTPEVAAVVGGLRGGAPAIVPQGGNIGPGGGLHARCGTQIVLSPRA